jgi:membrane associated rhomboid family serine protease
MLLPIGDVPNPKTTPYVNWLLIGINVAVFVIITIPLSSSRPDLNDPALLEYLNVLGARGDWTPQMVYDHITAYDLTVYRYGFRPAAFSPLTMFSAMFMHGGWMHLAGNMLFLWIYGDNVEHRLGHLGYLLAYLAAGVSATLFFSMFLPNSQIPMLGASGAISGVLGFYFLWFPRNRIKVFVFLFPLIMTTVLIPSRIVLGVYLVIDNILPFMAGPAEGSGVAYGAHIGGFLAGLGLALTVDRLPNILKMKGTTPRVARKRSNLVDVVTDVVRAIDQNDLARAAKGLQQLDSRKQRSQLTTPNILVVAEYLLDKGSIDEALKIFRKLISERPGDKCLDRAYLGAGRAIMHKPRSETSAWHYFMAVIDLAQTPEIAEEARSYLRNIENKKEAGA